MSENKISLEQKDLGDRPKFLVKELSTLIGPKYLIYFPTIEDAEKAVRNFWTERANYQSEQNRLGDSDHSTRTLKPVERGLQSGMLKPTQTITSGDRTEPYNNPLSESEATEFPGMKFRIEFNGNTQGLHEAGVEALKRLGFIK
jgi:hypothetical protein